MLEYLAIVYFEVFKHCYHYLQVISYTVSVVTMLLQNSNYIVYHVTSKLALSCFFYSFALNRHYHIRDYFHINLLHFLACSAVITQFSVNPVSLAMVYQNVLVHNISLLV